MLISSDDEDQKCVWGGEVLWLFGCCNTETVFVNGCKVLYVWLCEKLSGAWQEDLVDDVEIDRTEMYDEIDMQV